MTKYLYTLIAAILISSASSAQAPQIQWQKCLGGTNYEFGYDIHQTLDSGFIVAGSNGSSGYGGFDAWLVKLSADGTTEWQRRLGGSQADIALSVQQTPNGGYMAACNTSSADSDVSYLHGATDIWLVKLSPSGDILWEHCYGGSGEDDVMSLRQTPDGGFVVAGYTTSSDGDVIVNKGLNDIWVFKIDSLGAIQWQKTYGGTGNEYSSSIRVLDNGYILAGYTSSSNGDVTLNHGFDDTWVLRLSDTGAIVWQKTLGGSQYEFAEDVIVTSDSGFVVVGGTNSTDGDIAGNKGHGDAWVVKLSSSGTLQWQHCYGSSEDDAATSIRTTPSGDLLLSGWVGANDGDVSGFHGSTDFWLAKLTASGTITWQKPLGSLGSDVPRGMQPTFDGGYIMTGHIYYPGGDVIGFHGGSDIWVVKLNAPTEMPLLLDAQHLISAPNPTSDKLTIIGANDVDISVYSLNGQLLKYNARTNEISVSDLPAGIYTITVDSEDVIIYTGKIEKR